MSHHPRLRAGLEDLNVPGVMIDHRIIVAGDEASLLPEELAALANSVVKVRRASGAARVVARELMSRLRIAPQPILKSAAGMPVWPAGVVGSLAHDNTIAVAALAKRIDFLSIGIDIEPAESLDPELLDIVATPKERQDIADSPLQGRLLFAVKEAIYKAVYPLDRVFLEHHDVEVSFAKASAAVRNGRVVPFRYSQTSHFAVLAFVAAES
jgi:4'-phosphopantetheinyl transferase EntD